MQGKLELSAAAQQLDVIKRRIYVRNRADHPANLPDLLDPDNPANQLL